MSTELPNIYCPHCRAKINIASEKCDNCNKPVGWFKKMFAQRVYCPNMSTCPLYPQFQTSGALKLFMGAYCTKDFEQCERKKRGDVGEPVPDTLLPNGQSLQK